MLDRIFEETEGNPFFLSEVVNLMAQEGTLTKTSISDIAIPDGVREALGRRLNRLSEETNELLQVAAIIGRDFTYDTLTLLGDHDEDALLKMIEEALEARVIEETGRPAAIASRTRKCRRRCSPNSRRRAGCGCTVRSARRWRSVTALTPTNAPAVSRCTSARRRRCHRASARSPRSTRPSPGTRRSRSRPIRRLPAISGRRSRLAKARRWTTRWRGCSFDLGKAALDNGDVSEAWRSLRQAYDYYAQRGDVARAVDVAYRIGTHILLIRPSQSQLIERALGLVQEGTEEFGKLNAALGQSLGMLGRIADAREAFTRAEAVALELKLPRLELDVCGSAST